MRAQIYGILARERSLRCKKEKSRGLGAASGAQRRLGEEEKRSEATRQSGNLDFTFF
jgi:hypothetical protein